MEVGRRSSPLFSLSLHLSQLVSCYGAHSHGETVSDMAFFVITGAKVRVDCKSKTTGAKTCSFEGHTDRTGTYNILVADEHEHELCESVLVSSPDKGCANVVAGRERAPVFLTSNNGIASNIRLANALGFQKDVALPRCAQILEMYQDEDDRV
ncbi:unnamed protein product [Miscanthus lutarioriparius]|uniref:Pollen Ole e 1 allergen and extensin family protein n=1 Tax=Miscanthus lutarioriparius TaxID=422564 RepID=A0A811M8D7_9POAL|nr:unnamed protein product [Miscanthus lutarioriparius]